MSTEAAMTAGNRTSAAYYEKEYIPGIYKWGMITNTLGIILAFLPAMVISVVFGITPSFSMIVAGSTLQLMSGTLVSWLVDPIAMYPMLGMPGMFMSFLSGNISNLRLPALAAAQQGANVDAGTEKGNVIATIGIAVSNIVRCEWEPVKEMEVHKNGQSHCKGDCNNAKLPAFHEELAENTAE